MMAGFALRPVADSLETTSCEVLPANRLVWQRRAKVVQQSKEVCRRVAADHCGRYHDKENKMTGQVLSCLSEEIDRYRMS